MEEKKTPKPLRSDSKKLYHNKKDYVYIFRKKTNSKYFSENILGENGSLYMNHNSFYCFSFKVRKTKCW